MKRRPSVPRSPEQPRVVCKGTYDRDAQKAARDHKSLYVRGNKDVTSLPSGKLFRNGSSRNGLFQRDSDGPAEPRGGGRRQRGKR